MLSKTLSVAKYCISSSTVIQMKNIKTLVPRAKWQVIEHQKMAAETPLEGGRVKFNRFHFFVKRKSNWIDYFSYPFSVPKRNTFFNKQGSFFIENSMEQHLRLAASHFPFERSISSSGGKGGDQRTEIVLATTALVAVVALFLRSPPSSANN